MRGTVYGVAQGLTAGRSGGTALFRLVFVRPQLLVGRFRRDLFQFHAVYRKFADKFPVLRLRMDFQQGVWIVCQIVLYRALSAGDRNAVDFQVFLVVVDLPDVGIGVCQNSQRIRALVCFCFVSVECGSDFECPCTVFHGHTVNLTIFLYFRPIREIPVHNFQNRRVKIIQVAGLNDTGIVNVFYAVHQIFCDKLGIAHYAGQFNNHVFLIVSADNKVSTDKAGNPLPIGVNIRDEPDLSDIRPGSVRGIGKGGKFRVSECVIIVQAYIGGGSVSARISRKPHGQSCKRLISDIGNQNIMAVVIAVIQQHFPHRQNLAAGIYLAAVPMRGIQICGAIDKEFCPSALRRNVSHPIIFQIPPVVYGGGITYRLIQMIHGLCNAGFLLDRACRTVGIRSGINFNPVSRRERGDDFASLVHGNAALENGLIAVIKVTVVVETGGINGAGGGPVGI